MKRTIVILALLMSAVLIFSGCGRMVSKAIEKATEKAIEKDSGAKVDISGDGDSISVKGEDGSQMQAGDNVKWPDNAPSDIPKLENVKYNFIASGDDQSFTISFEAAEAKTIEAYIKQILDAGYEETSKMEMDGGILNTYTKGKISLSLTYTEKEQTGMLMVAVQE